MIAHAAQKISLRQSWICWWVGPKETQKPVWLEPSPGLGAQYSVGIWHRTVSLSKHKEGHCDPGTGQEWRPPPIIRVTHGEISLEENLSSASSILGWLYQSHLRTVLGSLLTHLQRQDFQLSAVTHAPCLLGWEGNRTESECENFQHNCLLYDWA